MTTQTVLYFPRTEFQRTNWFRKREALATSWNIQVADASIRSMEARRLISFWHPNGCIVNNDHLPASLFRGIPTVFTHRNRADISPGSALVSYDERGVAQFAARELLRLHCASYAYIPEGKLDYWDTIRSREFASALRTNSQVARVFPTPQDNLHGPDCYSALASWLSALPRPIGIFAAHDLISEIVLNACVHADIKCPQDAVILGVYSDASICENSRPTLSHIFFDEREHIDATFRCLDKLMRPRRSPARIEVLIPPAGVIHRSSTRPFPKPDSLVLSALDMIRLKGGEGLRARDVLATFPCSRRMAELRFRAATGHSVLEEILAVRQERIRQLRASGIKDEAVAQMCGYANRSSLHRLLSSSRAS